MSSSSHSTIFPARLADLRAVRSFVERFCGSEAIGHDACLRVNLVLEELFTNTVRHGHGRECDAPICVSLSKGPQAVSMIYEDTGPPFNPYAHLPSQAPEDTLELRKLGGLGILLTRELAATRDYAYIHGRNRIRLALRLR
ncbi:MAG TPA: ATP-binding protein [Burkholderiales bacterium]|nr:ATP-binding protein [Burkholderiales bacterium]